MTTMVAQRGADYIGIPKWFWGGIVLVALGSLSGLAVMHVVEELKTARATAIDVAVLKSESANTRDDLRKIENKVDRILQHFEK
jgi:hypothetical protein